MIRSTPCVAVGLLVLLAGTAGAQHLLLWDGEVADSGWGYEYGAPDSLEPHQGVWCFMGTPDPWHKPAIILGADGVWREDISTKDEIRFYARSDSLGRTSDFSISGWPYVSRSITIDPYIQGGALDTTYRQVAIPIDSLKTPEYDLSVIEIVYFGVAQPDDGHHIYVDDLWALDTSPVAIEGVQPLSDTMLRVSVGDRYDTTAAQEPSHYTLSSTLDPQFLDPVASQAVGMHYYVHDFPDAGPSPRIRYEIFLSFPDVMNNGFDYVLTISSLPDQAGNDLANPYTVEFRYEESDQINGSVKVNQVGYRPAAPKFGYVGNYLGSLGAMALNPAGFEIRDATSGALAYTGIPTMRGDDARLSGEVVYDCDFSALSVPGRYYLLVPGIGRSPEFAIGDDALSEAATAAARAFYYQRCGMALAPPYADERWVHGACHGDDAFIHESHLDSPLYNGEEIGSSVPMTGGWHDAGDYGKYVPTAAPALFYLFSAFELYPERFGDGTSGIPESGNGIPDLIDEAIWELRWLRMMQAPDGGVYHKVATTAWADCMPEDDDATRWIAPKTTHATALFAAIMASAGRIIYPYLPGFADSCLVQAETAWTFLEAHPSPVPEEGFVNPPGIGGGAYGDPDGDADDRAWAAAELYKATGDPSYHAKFQINWSQHSPIWGWNLWQHHQRKASWAYLTTGFPTDAPTIQQIKNEWRFEIEQVRIPWTDANVYRNAHRSDVLEWIGWGSFAQSSQYSLDFIMMSHALNESSYLWYAAVNLDTQLGNNPQALSYITGLGFTSPQDPTHHPSYHDAAEAPVPGLPVFGPAAHIPMSNQYYYEVQAVENLYPAGNEVSSPYPILRRYYDIFELPMMSEFTVLEMAVTTAALAYFSDVASGPGPVVLESPVISGISRQGGAIVLTWAPVPGATAYRVYSSLSPHSAFRVDLSGEFDQCSWNSTVDGAQARYFRLSAVAPGSGVPPGVRGSQSRSDVGAPRHTGTPPLSNGL